MVYFPKAICSKLPLNLQLQYMSHNQQIESIFSTQIEAKMDQNNSIVSESPDFNRCCVCFTDFDEPGNSFFKSEKIKCKNCKLKAHQLCFNPSSKTKTIICDSCEAKRSSLSKIRCWVCGGNEGMMKKIQNTIDKFGHVLCLLFSPLFLVKSYCELSFVQINYGVYQRNSFVCKLCSRLGEVVNSCCCTSPGCKELVHWRCLFKSQVDQDQLFWVSSFKRLSINNQPRYNLNEFYKRMQLYLLQFFGEFGVQFGHDQKIDQQSLGLKMMQFRVLCPKHSKKATKSCFCQKQSPSSLIFCDYCQSFNHTSCEQIKQNTYISNYKCIQCRSWGQLLKKGKRPYIQNYPSMNLYDYIYIQICYQENQYKMQKKQLKLLRRLPISPSLYFFSKFASKYLYCSCQMQSCLATIEDYIENYDKKQKKLEKRKSSAAIRKAKQITKSVMSVKILLSNFKDWGKLRDIFTEWQSQLFEKKQCQFSKEDLIKILGESNKRFRKIKVQTIEEDIQQKNSVGEQKNSEHGTETGINDGKANNKLDQVLDVELECNFVMKQTMEVEEIPQNYNIIIQQLNKNSQIQGVSFQNQTKGKLSQMVINQTETQAIPQINAGVGQQIKNCYGLLKTTNTATLIELARDSQLNFQQKLISRYDIWKETLFQHNMCLRILQMDLQLQGYKISQKDRYRILKYFENGRIQDKAKAKVMKIQWDLYNLIVSLNSLQNSSVNYISDLSKIKLTIDNISIFFNFFSKCKSMCLLKFKNLCSALKSLAQKLIHSNIKKCIKTLEQLDAYQTIIYNFNIQSEWLNNQLIKKRKVDKDIQRVRNELQNFNLPINYVKQYQVYRALLNAQILREALAYCQHNGMGYYYPVINKYRAWNQIYEMCLKLVHLLMQSETSSQSNKVNGNQLVEMSEELVRLNIENYQVSKIIIEYADKYKKLCNNLNKFLNRFSHNIKTQKLNQNMDSNTHTHTQTKKVSELKNSSIQTESIKLQKQQLLKELHNIKNSVFQCNQLVQQITDIIYIYYCLKKNLSNLQQQDHQARQVLENKINVIPIFDVE